MLIVQVLKQLGTGAQGCTYLVKRVDNNQLYALKMVVPDIMLVFFVSRQWIGKICKCGWLVDDCVSDFPSIKSQLVDHTQMSQDSSWFDLSLSFLCTLSDVVNDWGMLMDH